MPRHKTNFLSYAYEERARRMNRTTTLPHTIARGPRKHHGVMAVMVNPALPVTGCANPAWTAVCPRSGQRLETEQLIEFFRCPRDAGDRPIATGETAQSPYRLLPLDGLCLEANVNGIGRGQLCVWRGRFRPGFLRCLRIFR